MSKVTITLAALLFVGCGGKRMTPDEILKADKACFDRGMLAEHRESAWNQNVQSVRCVKLRECVEVRREP